MKVYKDGSYLVFDMEDGHMCKYDFASKIAYGFSGREVKNISSQLRGVSVDDVINSCTQPGYGYYLKYIASCYDNKFTNIGSLLNLVPHFARFEPFFTAGVKKIDRYGLRTLFRDVPSGLIRICREIDLKLDDDVIDQYKRRPDLFNTIVKTEYQTLGAHDIREIIRMCWHIIRLVEHYNYIPKSLMVYIDRIATYEAMATGDIVITLLDTIYMAARISPKFDRYPRYLRTTHDIVQRNFNRMKAEYDKAAFERRVNTDMERTIDKYKFIYPRTPQDIKDEAVQQNNCVASYIDRVIAGQCDILFMRLADHPDKSLVTLEVRDGKVVQRKRRYNNDTTPEQDQVIAKWESWYAGKCA